MGEEVGVHEGVVRLRVVSWKADVFVLEERLGAQSEI